MRLSAIVGIEQVTLRIVVAVDHLAVLIVLREARLGLRVDGRGAVACGGVQGDDTGPVCRLLVEVFSDLALLDGTVTAMDQEECEEDGEDDYTGNVNSGSSKEWAKRTGNDSTTSGDVLP